MLVLTFWGDVTIMLPSIFYTAEIEYYKSAQVSLHYSHALNRIKNNDTFSALHQSKTEYDSVFQSSQ